LLGISDLKDVTAVETVRRFLIFKNAYSVLIQLNFFHKINNSQVSWILGYLVYDLNNGVANVLNK
jgi:hypothetical protein